MLTARDNRCSRGEELQAEERRKKEIEDSKYLGGDVKHTHLVKGLDFALLKRVREETGADEEAMDTAEDTPAADAPEAAKEDADLEVGRRHGRGKNRAAPCPPNILPPPPPTTPGTLLRPSVLVVASSRNPSFTRVLQGPSTKRSLIRRW